MTTFPSREHRHMVGERFYPLHERESYHPPRHGLLECRTPNCPRTISLAPVILRAVAINDLCPGRHEAAVTRLHYSDGSEIFAPDRESTLKMIKRADGHCGRWPYALVEISYEVLRDGRYVACHLRPRFDVRALRQPYPDDFLRAAQELRLAPDRLNRIISLHSDPRVEEALVLPLAA